MHERRQLLRTTYSRIIKVIRTLHYFLLILVPAIIVQGCKTNSSRYFDQKPPNSIPELFAPSLVNTQSVELNVVFNTSYTEMFFSRIEDNSFVIHHSELVDGIWTPIQPIQMYPDSISISVACDPTITQDGNTMYFLGVDPKNYSHDISPAELYRIPPDIFVSRKTDGRWQYASKVGSPVSTRYFESYPIVVADGSLYYQSDRPNGAGGRDTYRSQYLGNGKFDTSVSINLDSKRNPGSTYISPDERYLISSDGKGFKVSFKKEGKWQTPVDIDLPYEDDWVYFCPYMSPDEKFFFFSRRYFGSRERGWAGVTQGEVYWVSADVVFNLKQD